MARIGYLYGYWYDTHSTLIKSVHIYYKVFKQTTFSRKDLVPMTLYQKY